VARGRGFARTRDDHDLRRFVGFELVQRFAHFAMQLRTHGVALFRAVQDQEYDSVRFALDLDRLVGLFRHVAPP
jgi:hypothetical protein